MKPIRERLREWVSGRRRSPADRQSVVSQHLPCGSTGAEIGVWKGGFSAFLLREIAPRRLHLVDPWKFEQSYAESLYGGLEAKSQADMDAIHDDVARRFRDEIARGQVVLHRSTSQQAASSLEDESLDWVYIDANHLYEFVRADLHAFLPKVRVGGLITGDDYAEGGWWKGGVKRAVDEFIRESGCEVVALKERQYVLRRKPG